LHPELLPRSNWVKPLDAVDRRRSEAKRLTRQVVQIR